MICFLLAFFTVSFNDRNKNNYFNTKISYQKVNIIAEISDIVEFEKHFLLKLENCFISGKKSNFLFSNIKLNLNKDFKPNFGLKIGQRIEVPVKFFPKNKINYNLNNKLNLYTHNIKGFAIAQNYPILIKNKLNNNFFRSFTFNIRNKIDQVFFTNLKKENATIASALVTGRSERIPADIIKNIRDAGLAHILAISGLHISIVGLGFFSIFRIILNLTNFSYKIDVKLWASILSLLCCFIFLLISGIKISAIRASIMFSIITLSNILGRESLAIRSIFCSATIMLISEPHFLASPSFQLSFISVIFLVQNWNFLNFSSTSKHSFSKKIIKYFIGNLSSSFIGSCASLVFSVYHFFQFPIYAVLANFLLLPIFTIFIMPLIITGLFLKIFALEKFIFNILDHLLDFFLFCTNFISKLPYSTIKTGYISESLLAIFLFAVAWMVIWQSKIRHLSFLLFGISLYGIFYFPKINYLLLPNFNLIENQQKYINIYYLKKIPTNKEILFWKNVFAKEEAYAISLNQKLNLITDSEKKINIFLIENSEKLYGNYNTELDNLSIYIPKNIKLSNNVKIINNNGILSFSKN
ncbi:MAG: ComEC/Rec2 family competence protein [Rickettsia sp.]|nr:ComEC/Rec2 family competence protein [Rickettsia sp.]